MTFPSDPIKEQLHLKIDDTLQRVEQLGEYCYASDLYDVIRWAREGYLTRKVETNETT